MAGRRRFTLTAQVRLPRASSLMGTHDYTLQVAQIDVDDARERELNLLLNNQQAAGSWDMEALKHIFDDNEVTLVGAGFDHADMIQMFGDNVFTNRAQDLEELAQSLAKISDQYTAAWEKNRAKGTREAFLVFVFPHSEDVDRMIEALGLQDNRYQSGVFLMEKLGITPLQTSGTKKAAAAGPRASQKSDTAQVRRVSRRSAGSLPASRN